MLLHVTLRFLRTWLASRLSGGRTGWTWCSLALTALLTGCALPPLEGRSQSTPLALSEALQTTLGQSLAPLLEVHPGLSGVHPLPNAHDAFAARAVLARAAQRTLDVQYYIWRDDKTGRLQLDELLQAADRGVRVRVLLDDNGTTGLDDALEALHAHPHIEVRLFNPFVVRAPKLLGYVVDFARANRRMHNKSYTADNLATIIGGRNMADAYFGATDGVLFADLDVLAIGPVVQDISQDFNAYWDSASAYPADRILRARHEPTRAAVLNDIRSVRSTEAAQDYLNAIRHTPLVQQLRDGTLPWEWARVTMVSDDPAKGLGPVPASGLVMVQLDALLGEPHLRLDLVSPYLVPTDSGVQAFGRMRANGVQVRILTNSIAATDVPAVHAGYAKHREALLQQGVELYEMRRQTPRRAQRLQRARDWLQNLNNSDASLHAKTFAVDGQRVFIGSLNFDPRSVRYNTELGFLIESPRLAEEVHRSFDTQVPRTAWKVTQDAEGSLQWMDADSYPPEIHTTEPDTSALGRALIRLLTLLPLEHLL